MNPLDELKRAHESVVAEEKRLTQELGKLRAVREALEKGMKLQTSEAPKAPRASPGGLKAAILDVLGTEPMANSDIRAALKKAGYEYSLSPLHVTKTLIMLIKAKKVKRVGTGTLSKYLKKSP